MSAALLAYLTEFLHVVISNLIRAYKNSHALRVTSKTSKNGLSTYRSETSRSFSRPTQVEIERERNRTQANLDTDQKRQQLEAGRVRRMELHWKSLGGIEFEHELANLYSQLGYTVQSTPHSGDQGIDLDMTKVGKRIIVQCKAHKNPVSPAVVRELFGALIDSGADEAILACPSGFTKGVWEFVKSKPIQLVAADELMSMSKQASIFHELLAEPPVLHREFAVDVEKLECSFPGCGSLMLMHFTYDMSARYWQCPKYPTAHPVKSVFR